LSTIFNTKIIDLIPPNLQNNADIIAASKAADDSIANFVADYSKVLLYANIDNISDEDILDTLAVEEHLDYYYKTLDIDTKKNLIKNSIKIHRKKGTKQAVEDLATDVFGFAVVSEWFEYAGSAYNFKIQIDYTAGSSQNIQEFSRLIESVKNVRSSLEAIELVINSSINIQENIYKTDITRNTTLNLGFKLGVTPFATPGSEVQIK